MSSPTCLTLFELRTVTNQHEKRCSMSITPTLLRHKLLDDLWVLNRSLQSFHDLYTTTSHAYSTYGKEMALQREAYISIPQDSLKEYQSCLYAK